MNLGLNRGCLKVHVFIVTRLVLNLGVHLSMMLFVLISNKSIMNSWDSMRHCNVLRHVLISSRLGISVMSLGGLMLDNWD